jgi:hypothetical protein
MIDKIIHLTGEYPSDFKPNMSVMEIQKHFDAFGFHDARMIGGAKWEYQKAHKGDLVVFNFVFDVRLYKEFLFDFCDNTARRVTVNYIIIPITVSIQKETTMPLAYIMYGSASDPGPTAVPNRAIPLPRIDPFWGKNDLDLLEFWLRSGVWVSLC